MSFLETCPVSHKHTIKCSLCRILDQSDLNELQENYKFIQIRQFLPRDALCALRDIAIVNRPSVCPRR